MKFIKNEEIRKSSALLVTGIVGWFISAGFIYWGWTVLAPHINAPEFGYWEILALRLALGSVVKIFAKK